LIADEREDSEDAKNSSSSKNDKKIEKKTEDVIDKKTAINTQQEIKDLNLDKEAIENKELKKVEVLNHKKNAEEAGKVLNFFVFFELLFFLFFIFILY
jgi:hypothetical protein